MASPPYIDGTAVCDAAGITSCPCILARQAENSTVWSNCFSELVCAYDYTTGLMCSGNGEW